MNGATAQTESLELIRVELPASYKYLNVLGAFIREMLSRAFSEEVAKLETVSQEMELAVHEVCTNIVTHAYAQQPGQIIQLDFKLYPNLGKLEVELHDHGQNFDYSAVAEPDLENGQVHGYGLYIVRSLVDELFYEPQVGGNYWRLVKFF